MNLIELILSEMQDDDADTEDQSQRLEQVYDEADQTGKKAIDDTLICLCGYSMDSLRNKL